MAMAMAMAMHDEKGRISDDLPENGSRRMKQTWYVYALESAHVHHISNMYGM